MQAHFFARSGQAIAVALQAMAAQDSALARWVHPGNETDQRPERTGVATGFAVLDAFLPWGGWPVGAMTEVMTDAFGAGELSLLLPAMSRLASEKRPIAMIGLPHELFAPALAQANVDPQQVTQILPSARTHDAKELLWSSEQILKSGAAALVVLWSVPTSPHRSAMSPEALRRLHLACLGQETTFIHYRAASCTALPSPAWLRFGFSANEEQIRLQVLKCRGRLLARPLVTLDRAAVQARLATRLNAERLLARALEDGLPAAPRLSHPVDLHSGLPLTQQAH